MALRNLVEPQCGQANPLLSLTQHMTKDKAHKEDTYFTVPHHEVESYKTPYGIPLSAEQLAEEFMNETRYAATATPQTFRMDTLLQEMHAIERGPPLLGPAVADLASEAQTWCKEFLDNEQPLLQERPFEPGLAVGKGFDEHHKDVEPSQWLVEAEAKWTEASTRPNVEPDEAVTWLKEYNAQEDSELAKTANELLGTVEDPKFWNTEFMKYVRTLGSDQSSSPFDDAKMWQQELMGSAEDFLGPEFIQHLSHTQPQDQATSASAKVEEWSNEFAEAQKKGNLDDVTVDSEAMSEKEKEQFWQRLQEDWNQAASQNGDAYSWLSDYEADYGEPFQDYSFKEDNPLKNHPDPLSEGKRCLEAGDVPSAVLFFEAAVQQSSENTEAWLLLGTTHAQNEQDPAAIPALRRVTELDASNLKAWMALATSYTNESYQNYACHALKEWIRNNKEYSHLVVDEKSSSHPKVLVASLAPREQIEEVQNLYLKATNLRPLDSFDENLQCGLGILLNLTGDYDKAVDCFHSALQSRPTDPHLWNKLGATLANSNRAAEAIEAYRNALQLSPGFIRCRYNLGIACINLGAYKEAMEHFLETLNLQEKSRGVEGQGPSLAVSDNIWTTVRVCLRHLQKQDLMDTVHNRDLKRLNQEFGTANSS